MTTPVSRDVRIPFESMRDTVVNFLLVRIGLVIRFADTFCDNLGIALFVAGIFAVRALHACSIFQKVPTKSAPHDIVKLLGNKLVALFFMHFLFLLADCTLPIETDVEWAAVLQLFGYIMVRELRVRGFL